MGGSQSDKPSGRKAFPPHTQIWGARETQAPLLSCTGGNATHCGRQGLPPQHSPRRPDVTCPHGGPMHHVSPPTWASGNGMATLPTANPAPAWSAPPRPLLMPAAATAQATGHQYLRHFLVSLLQSTWERGQMPCQGSKARPTFHTWGSRSLQTMACSLCLPSPTLWPQELAGEQCGGPQVSAPGESVLCGALCQVPPPLSPVGSASSPFQQGRWALPTFPAARPSLRGRAQGAPQTQVLVSGLQGLAWPEDRCPPPCLDLTRQSLRTDCPCSTLLWGGAGKDLPRFWQILQPQRKRPWP